MAKEMILKLWRDSAGYKTNTAGLLTLLFEFFKLIFGENFISEKWQNWIISFLVVLASTGLFHKLWRNRKIIINRIINIFKKKEHGN